ncbi:hypothetical protein GOBAR_AA25379 [Gossypium barbadense]|uniref:Uncharacterized protein n=1 Tax=Gossypium barbadense TaxID=3634 RepID=A0A2P5WW17_GOSBA|nr:hypothetical protein GOBAR_AA25379 [Gossypium barbadense]
MDGCSTNNGWMLLHVLARCRRSVREEAAKGLQKLLTFFFLMVPQSILSLRTIDSSTHSSPPQSCLLSLMRTSETEMFKRLKKAGKHSKVVEQSGSSDVKVYRKAYFNAAKKLFPT